MNDYFSIIEDFSRIKILVVGDVMLDRYWWGNVSRISPEAPVPVVNLKKNSLVAGGAANVAANIRGLGAETFLFGAVGFDEEAGLFKKVLDEIAVSREFLLPVKNRPTTIKTRVVAHNQHVVRIDQEDSRPLSSWETDEFFEKIQKVIPKSDVIVLSDYAKGVLTDDLLARLITSGLAAGKPIIVDPKGKNYQKYKGATLITPNRFEAVNASGFEENNDVSIDDVGGILLSANDLSAVLITRGEQGMTLYRKDCEPVNFKASARKVYDVTGAGDTVIATLAAVFGVTEDLVLSAELANLAAGLVVEEVGTTIIEKEKLKKHLSEQ